MARPKGPYCFVCRKERPCASDAPCQTLGLWDRLKAYRDGYYAKRHPDAISRGQWQATIIGRRALKKETIRRGRAERHARAQEERAATARQRTVFGEMLQHWALAAWREKRAQRAERDSARQALRDAKRAENDKKEAIRRLAEQNRQAAHQERLRLAAERHQAALEKLATYNGPGGGKNLYSSREAAQKARQEYRGAYMRYVYPKTVSARARERDKEALERAEGKPRRSRRPPGTAAFYRRLYTDESLRCYYCDQPMTFAERTGDHFIPLARDGEHSADNLVACCRDCNQRKGDKMPLDFHRELLDKLLS